MKKFISLMLILTILLLPIKAQAVEFSDLASDHWAKSYIDNLTNEGVISGYPDGTFRPERYVSFLESLTMIQKIKQPDQAEIENALKSYGSLADKYKISPWAKEAFTYCLYKNIIYQSEVEDALKKGYLVDDPSLNDAYPKREDLAVYFARALEVPPSYDHSNLLYKDLDQIGRALGNDLDIADYLSGLVKLGIFDSKGSEGYFEGDRPFRRAELCKITYLSLIYLANQEN
ncbi:S-layer homology domain-containing protein [Neofamilia massiliensis]|uniref:S-layer homology domain-containing protein n=1 Tax=Neofamilia massiliensis TaxID=1673724 RepID=UPI0006BB8D5D|nr:S-layer homology domain-containing protein [Neofamilia massiliensis]